MFLNKYGLNATASPIFNSVTFAVQLINNVFKVIFKNIIAIDSKQLHYS